MKLRSKRKLNYHSFDIKLCERNFRAIFARKSIVPETIVYHLGFTDTDIKGCTKEKYIGKIDLHVKFCHGKSVIHKFYIDKKKKYSYWIRCDKRILTSKQIM